MNKRTEHQNNTANDLCNVLTTSVFLRLGKRQKDVIRMMVIEDYYISELHDLRDGSITIQLVDECHNIDRDISRTLLESLKKRGLFTTKEITMWHELPTINYKLKEQYANAAMEACC